MRTQTHTCKCACTFVYKSVDRIGHAGFQVTALRASEQGPIGVPASPLVQDACKALIPLCSGQKERQLGLSARPDAHLLPGSTIFRGAWCSSRSGSCSVPHPTQPKLCRPCTCMAEHLICRAMLHWPHSQMLECLSQAGHRPSLVMKEGNDWPRHRVILPASKDVWPGCSRPGSLALRHKHAVRD